MLLTATVLLATIAGLGDEPARVSVKAAKPPKIKVVGDVVSVDTSARTVTVRVPGTVAAMNVGGLTTDVAPRTLAGAPAPSGTAPSTVADPVLPATGATRPQPATMALPPGVVAGPDTGTFTVTFPDSDDHEGIGVGDRIEIRCKARPTVAGATGNADNPFADCAAIDDIDKVAVTKPPTQ